MTWRSGGDYCGWAPLPPLAVFRPGFGFFYRGVSVGLDFDFGLDAGYFMFISPSHFCDRRPRSYCVEPARVTQVFHQTTVINNFSGNNHTFVNHGIPVEHIRNVTHHTIEPVHVGSLPNAGRQGWRGEGFDRSPQRGPAENNGRRNFSNGNGELHQGSALHNDQGNIGNAIHHENISQSPQGGRQGGNQAGSSLPNVKPNPKSTVNNDQNVYRQQHRNEPVVTGNDHFQPAQQSGGTAGAVVPDRRQTQNVVREQQPSPRQFRSYDTPSVSASQQHGAEQLSQHQFVPPSQPRVEPRVEAAPRSYSPPTAPPAPAPAPAQSQPRNTGGGSDHTPSKDKQNH